MPSQWMLILRLLLAAGLAGALGGERELTEQPAGFRTHILVGVGAALFAILSAYGLQIVTATDHTPGLQGDPTRIAAQIVVGIGFLGGGAILKYGASIRGLTTAASLWVTAAVGTAVGFGALLLATTTTGITLLALVGLRPLRRVLRRRGAGHHEFAIQADAAVDVSDVVTALRSSGAELVELKVLEQDGERTLQVTARLPRAARPEEVVAELTRLPHVHGVDWSP